MGWDGATFASSVRAAEEDEDAFTDEGDSLDRQGRVLAVDAG